ncbi:hypothetical protein A6R68_01272, partial [Neotoma lepida]
MDAYYTQGTRLNNGRPQEKKDEKTHSTGEGSKKDADDGVEECEGGINGFLEKERPVSVLTTLERRFNLQSADVGVIASSFEIGNLALILFVSYFGARGHRPRLIGCGGIVMALGALLSALPEFLTHQYKYEAGEIRWGAEGRDVCATNGSSSDEGPDPDLICRNRTATNMMYLLLIGAQVLLGIGATPVQPLGVSYIDDHVRRKDSSLYIGCVAHNENHTEEWLIFDLGIQFDRAYRTQVLRGLWIFPKDTGVQQEVTCEVAT